MADSDKNRAQICLYNEDGKEAFFADLTRGIGTVRINGRKVLVGSFTVSCSAHELSKVSIEFAPELQWEAREPKPSE